MSASVPARPLVSLELRWFYDGALPEAIREWFRSGLPGEQVSEVDDRDDTYLFQPRHEGFGVKLRQAQPRSPYTLEIKWREHARPFQGAHGVAGQVERWLKLGWKDPEGPGPESLSDFALPAGPWVTVGKRRWQRKYDWADGALNPVAPKSRVDSGAVVEIVELELGGRPYSSLLIESYAADEPAQERILRAAIEQLMRNFPEPRPGMTQSYGYPFWLARLAGDAFGIDRRGARVDALMTLEHEHLSAQFMANEDMGEKRVSLFFSLTAGLGAAAILAWEKLGGNAPAVYAELFIAVTGVWLMFGYLTFLRIVRRNAITDKYKRQFRALRSWFVERADIVACSLLPYNPYGEPDRFHEGLSFHGGSGGYAEFVGLINSVIAGALAWQLTHYSGSNRSMAALLVAVAAALAVWMAQGSLARKVYRERRLP